MIAARAADLDVPGPTSRPTETSCRLTPAFSVPQLRQLISDRITAWGLMGALPSPTRLDTWRACPAGARFME